MMSYGFPRRFDYAYPCDGPVRISLGAADAPALEQPPIARDAGSSALFGTCFTAKLVFAVAIAAAYAAGRFTRLSAHVIRRHHCARYTVWPRHLAAADGRDVLGFECKNHAAQRRRSQRSRN